MQHVGIDGNGMPNSLQDFKAVFERLKDYKGEGSDYDVTDLAIEEMYKALLEDSLKNPSIFVEGVSGQPAKPKKFSFTAEGVTHDSFKDLVDLEKETRKDEITELVEAIEDQEEAIEANSDFAILSYKDIDAEMKDLYNDM